jgi:hypothetical protein
LIKVVLALEYGKIPPTYGIKRLNPKCEGSYLFSNYAWLSDEERGGMGVGERMLTYG